MWQGWGPGPTEQMTLEARAALDTLPGHRRIYGVCRSDQTAIPGENDILTTPMTQEVKRCQMALEEAAGGRDVAMVCSGDAGIYGMAGLMYETGAEYPDVGDRDCAGDYRR